jgi:thiamine biosynthesis lipoprotein
MQRYQFEAMGTTVDCLLEAEPGREAWHAFNAVEAEFERIEAMLSRFRESSELSRLNRSGEAEVSAELLEVTLLALDARDRTQGRFDPTVCAALEAAGYDRSFELVEDGEHEPRAQPSCGGEVHVDPARSRISLASGVRLDFGGIGKGYAVDEACDLLAVAGPCLVNAGGDLAVRGVPLEGEWSIRLRGDDEEFALLLEQGAVATSGRDRRRWTRGGELRHHLIDPRTGEPSTTDLVRVTVAAPTAVEAEVLAKALFLAGSATALAEAEAEGLPALLVSETGETLRVGAMA